MRILLFNRVAHAGGGGRNQYVLDMAKRLREHGEEVALAHGRNEAADFTGTRYVLDALTSGENLNQLARQQLEAVLVDFEPDLVQLHHVDNLAVDDYLLERVPTVRFIHNHEAYCSGGDMTLSLPRQICTRPHGSGCLRCHILRRCGSGNPILNIHKYQKTTRWIATLQTHKHLQVASPVVRENLIRNGVHADRVEYIPLYAPEPAVKKRPIRTARRMILHPSGMMRNKGVWMMARLARKLPADIELVYAGGGNQSHSLSQYVRAHGLSERVRIMGEIGRKGMSELYHQAEVVVLPSRWNEPVGIQGLYAMAHGKPVVAFRSVGVEGWLEDGRNGALVPFNDANAFLETLNRCLESPNQLRQMGMAARQMWEERYRTKYHVAKVREYFQRVTASDSSDSSGGISSTTDAANS